MPPSTPVVVLRKVDKSYATPAGSFEALRGVDLEIAAGEVLAIIGRSGSGKSTLLNVIGGLDPPTRGEVIVAGQAVHGAPEKTLAPWRGRTVGVVFQFFQLLPTLTVVENVMLPMDFGDVHPPRERRARAMARLEEVGIADQADKLPGTLSGGQQQRAAIARALANDPKVVTADEPTGNLDSTTAGAVLGLLGRVAARGTTVIIATHERDIARHSHRMVSIADGQLEGTAR